MAYLYRPIVNSDLIGEKLTISLPGFSGGKAEKCSMHYLTLGEGEPLLLVHSLGQSLYTWRDMIPLLAEKYNVIAPDLVGFGFSGRPVSMNYSMDEMADALVEFIKALKLYHVHAVGASLGGMYLLRAMSRFPEMFDKVTVLCPGGITKQMPKIIRRMAAPFFGPFARERYTKKDIRNALQQCYYDSTVLTREVLNEYFETMDSYSSRQAFMYCLRNFDEELVWEGLRTSEHPVFVLWGEEDRIQPFENLEKAQSVLRRGEFFSIRNAGHFFQEEKAELLADMVDKYILYGEDGV
jgi:pimeloyl-ACP methyl ester carboxylesterase